MNYEEWRQSQLMMRYGTVCPTPKDRAEVRELEEKEKENAVERNKILQEVRNDLDRLAESLSKLIFFMRDNSGEDKNMWHTFSFDFMKQERSCKDLDTMNIANVQLISRKGWV